MYNNISEVDFVSTIGVCYWCVFVFEFWYGVQSKHGSYTMRYHYFIKATAIFKYIWWTDLWKMTMLVITTATYVHRQWAAVSSHRSLIIVAPKNRWLQIVKQNKIQYHMWQLLTTKMDSTPCNTRNIWNRSTRCICTTNHTSITKTNWIEFTRHRWY